MITAMGVTNAIISQVSSPPTTPPPPPPRILLPLPPRTSTSPPPYDPETDNIAFPNFHNPTTLASIAHGVGRPEQTPAWYAVNFPKEHQQLTLEQRLRHHPNRARSRHPAARAPTPLRSVRRAPYQDQESTVCLRPYPSTPL